MPNLKILHCGSFHKIPIGIRRQLDAEYAAAKRTDLPWHTRFWSHDNIAADWHYTLPAGLITSFQRKSFVTRWLLSAGSEYDAILFRYPKGDISLPLRAPHFPPLFTIHHSKTITSIVQKSTLSRGILGTFLERSVSQFTRKSLAGVVGITEEVRQYESFRLAPDKPSTVFTNGVDLRDIPLTNDNRGAKLAFAFVSSYFTPWQGLDLVLSTFLSYPELGHLHVVGEVPEKILREARQDLRQDGRIHFYGLLEKEHLFEVLSMCDVGLGAFAYERKQASEAGQLKVKEYLGAGLPVITGYVESGMPADFPYIFVSAISCVDRWRAKVEGWRRVSRAQIREYAASYIDKEILLRDQYEWICSALQQEQTQVLVR